MFIYLDCLGFSILFDHILYMGNWRECNGLLNMALTRQFPMYKIWSQYSLSYDYEHALFAVEAIIINCSMRLITSQYVYTISFVGNDTISSKQLVINGQDNTNFT